MSPDHLRLQPAQAFAGAVRDTRESAALTTDELAARAGVTPSNLEAIERGERAPELETIVQIAAALGVSGAELLARAEL
jgi:transcriptional regulator with XRE-family HTH domain